MRSILTTTHDYVHSKKKKEGLSIRKDCLKQNKEAVNTRKYRISLEKDSLKQNKYKEAKHHYQTDCILSFQLILAL